MVTLMTLMMTARATSMATGSTWWTAGNQRASDVTHPTFTMPVMSPTGAINVIAQVNVLLMS